MMVEVDGGGGEGDRRRDEVKTDLEHEEINRRELEIRGKYGQVVKRVEKS